MEVPSDPVIGVSAPGGLSVVGWILIACTGGPWGEWGLTAQGRGPPGDSVVPDGGISGNSVWQPEIELRYAGVSGESGGLLGRRGSL